MKGPNRTFILKMRSANILLLIVTLVSCSAKSQDSSPSLSTDAKTAPTTAASPTTAGSSVVSLNVVPAPSIKPNSPSVCSKLVGSVALRSSASALVALASSSGQPDAVAVLLQAAADLDDVQASPELHGTPAPAAAALRSLAAGDKSTDGKALAGAFEKLDKEMRTACGLSIG